MDNEKQILKELKNLLEHHFCKNIKEVILFGSRARGAANANSDYDVLIVLNTYYDWQFKDKVSDLVYDLELKYDILIDQFLISTNELQYSLRGAQPVFVNAIENGVYV
jgi:uncharacterized protein